MTSTSKTKNSAYEYMRWLFTIGIQPGQRFSRKRDIVFTNEVIFFLSVISISISIIQFSAGNYGRTAINCAVAMSLIPGYYLQSKFRYKQAKVLTISIPTLMAITSVLVFGFASNAHYYILATMILSLVLFQSFREHLFSLLWHGPLFIGLLFLEKSWVAPIAGQDPSWMGMVNMSLVVFSIFVTLREFSMVFQSFESKVVDLVDSIQEKNAELQAQKDFIVEQSLTLQNTNLELQKSVREHEHMENLLRASNENLEHFAYMASHDLKEPLRTVGSFTSLIQRRLNGNLSSEISEYFNFVNLGVKRMTTLLDDVLTMSRMKKEMPFSKVDLNNVMAIVQSNLKAKTNETEAKIKVAVLPEIMGNKMSLVQLFQNLIANGLKFRQEAPPIIQVKCETRGTQLFFSISDNGIGIADEYQEKVFQIFQRLHDRTKYDGSGIGLAICKKIVEKHGGDIWLESEKNVGSTIYFTLEKNSSHIPVNNHDALSTVA